MRVAIAGYGQEGAANYQYWLAKGAQIVIFDEKEPAWQVPQDASLHIGADAFSKMNGFDLVIRTASLNPNKIKTDGKVWSATNEFFAQSLAPIIGVTGTKGKGTTCSLIAKMLESAGKNVHLVGNIGVSAIVRLPKIKAEDIVVFELSSFQLWDVEKSPQTAVALMIEPDHQDIHASMAEYIEAKANIGKFQTNDDLLIYHPTNKYSAEIAGISAAQKKRYLTPEGAQIVDSKIVIEENVICDVSEVGLIGAHNLENVCAAVTAAWNYTQNVTAIKAGIISFKGLPHRLEFAGEIHGIKYYDDSQATGSGSVLAALRSFAQPTVLILGGSDKGVDVSAVIDELDTSRHFVILIGTASTRLEELLLERQFTNYINLGIQVTMTEIVQTATSHAKPGSVVVLSPAHASFDMFKNYQDRGDQFKAAVKKLS